MNVERARLVRMMMFFGVSAWNSLAERGVQEVSLAQLLGDGVLEKRFDETLTGLEQPEALVVLVDALELDSVHRPTSASACVMDYEVADLDVGVSIGPAWRIRDRLTAKDARNFAQATPHSTGAMSRWQDEFGSWSLV